MTTPPETDGYHTYVQIVDGSPGGAYLSHHTPICEGELVLVEYLDEHLGEGSLVNDVDISGPGWTFPAPLAFWRTTDGAEYGLYRRAPEPEDSPERRALEDQADEDNYYQEEES